MDFLKDIVKEIGDDYTKLASDISDSESFIDTGSLVFNGLVSGSIFGGVCSNKITAMLERAVLEKLFSLSPLPRTFWMLTPMLMYSILILRVALLGHF